MVASSRPPRYSNAIVAHVPAEAGKRTIPRCHCLTTHHPQQQQEFGALPRQESPPCILPGVVETTNSTRSSCCCGCLETSAASLHEDNRRPSKKGANCDQEGLGPVFSLLDWNPMQLTHSVLSLAFVFVGTNGDRETAHGKHASEPTRGDNYDMHRC